MVIHFCEKCSGMLVPRISNEETLLLCNRCGWFKIIEGASNILKVQSTFSHETKGQGVVDKSLLNKGYKHKCKFCDNEDVEILDAGARYSDEDNLILLRCLRCGASERLGRKCT